MVSDFAAGDPDAELVWGAFEGDRLVAIAAASVRLPTIWIVAGSTPIRRPAGVASVEPLCRR